MEEKLDQSVSLATLGSVAFVAATLFQESVPIVGINVDIRSLFLISGIVFLVAASYPQIDDRVKESWVRNAIILGYGFDVFRSNPFADGATHIKKNPQF